jgi:osmoprotectant transport system ATP-binding protein
MVAMDEGYLDRYPKELSGGQQQRVGLARGLAGDPPVMLMDEPFGAVDPINREIIQDEFLKMQAKLRKTILFVSHDIDEAVKMGDKIAIFREGRLVQFGTPDDLLANPAVDFVADFVGSDRELKRMRLIRVREAMDTEVPTIGADDSAKTALERMRQAKRDLIVVVDATGRAQGFLGADDIEAAGDKTCRDVQRPLATQTDAFDDLRTAVSRMFTHDIKWLPVIDDRGKFVGVITNEGIAAALHRRRRGNT